jgi:plastocyanin
MSSKSVMWRSGTALGVVVILTGFGLVSQSNASTGRAPFAAPAKTVLIKETNERYHYTPAKMTVAKGTTVTWINRTDVEHNVTAKQGMKIDKDIEKGKSVRVTFTKVGTYRYHCEYHPYMKGTIVVK